MNKKADLLKHYLIQNAVPILFIVVAPSRSRYRNFPGPTGQEMLVRLPGTPSSYSLLIPIMAGMGLNFAWSSARWQAR